MTYKIAIQGILGSFSSQAAKKFFEEKINKEQNQKMELVECSTFLEVFEKIESQEADFGAIPIENSIAGSIHENYDYLKKFQFRILSELFLPIHHQLLVKKNTKLQEIKAVYSHPKAIEQCGLFLRKNNLKAIIHGDTALSAKLVKESPEKIASISSIQAKEVYDLEVLQKNIEDVPNNFTRFLLISKKDLQNLEGLEDLKNNLQNLKTSKNSIAFQLKHQPGSLLKTLQILEKYQANLTKIESRPIPEKEFEYQFYCDFICQQEDFSNIKKELQKETEEIIFLGSYKSAS